MKISKLGWVGVLAVLACLTTRSATAVDGKVLPASACSYEAEHSVGHYAVYGRSGSVFGQIWDGTAAQELPPGFAIVVTCPIARDNTTAPITSVRARLKRGSGLAPQCTLHSVSPTNGAVATKSAAVPDAVPAGTIHDLNINATGLTNWSGGSYSLSCILWGTQSGLSSPSTLLSYYWEEP